MTPLKIAHPELNWNAITTAEERNNRTRAARRQADVVARQREKLSQKGFFTAAVAAIKDGWNN